MNALHIASYFNAAPVVALLLKSCDLWPVVAIESVCGSFEYGTSLHIAAACLSCEAAEVLLQVSCSFKRRFTGSGVVSLVELFLFSRFTFTNDRFAFLLLVMHSEKSLFPLL